MGGWLLRLFSLRVRALRILRTDLVRERHLHWRWSLVSRIWLGPRLLRTRLLRTRGLGLRSRLQRRTRLLSWRSGSAWSGGWRVPRRRSSWRRRLPRWWWIPWWRRAQISTLWRVEVRTAGSQCQPFLFLAARSMAVPY